MPTTYSPERIAYLFGPLDKALKVDFEAAWERFLFDWDRLTTGTSDPVIRAQDIKRLDTSITQLGKLMTESQKACEDVQLTTSAALTWLQEQVAAGPAPVVQQTQSATPDVEEVDIDGIRFRVVFRGHPFVEEAGPVDALGNTPWLRMKHSPSEAHLELTVIVFAMNQRMNRMMGGRSTGKADSFSPTFGASIVPRVTTAFDGSTQVKPLNGINIHNIHKPGE
jgi:hypothetical protein